MSAPLALIVAFTPTSRRYGRHPVCGTYLAAATFHFELAAAVSNRSRIGYPGALPVSHTATCRQLWQQEFDADQRSQIRTERTINRYHRRWSASRG